MRIKDTFPINSLPKQGGQGALPNKKNWNTTELHNNYGTKIQKMVLQMLNNCQFDYI